MLCIIRKLTAIYCNLRLRHVVYYWILVLLGRMGIWHTEVSFIDLFKSVGLLLSFLQLLLNLPVPSLLKCLTNIYYCFLLICCSLKVLYFHYFCVCCNMKVAFFCLFVEVLVQLGCFFFFFAYICYALWYVSGRVAYKDESTWYKWYKAVVGREWDWRQIQLNWKAHSANSSRIDQSLNFLSLTVLSLLTRRVIIFNFQVSIIIL